jgi:hypothetical protein
MVRMHCRVFTNVAVIHRVKTIEPTSTQLHVYSLYSPTTLTSRVVVQLQEPVAAAQLPAPQTKRLSHAKIYMSLLLKSCTPGRSTMHQAAGNRM